MNREPASPTRLYKNRENKVLCGVCAGIADYFGFDVTLTRVLAVLSQFMFPATFLVYIALCILLPDRPDQLYKSESDKEFWKGVRVSPTTTFSDVLPLGGSQASADRALRHLEELQPGPGVQGPGEGMSRVRVPGGTRSLR